MKSQLNDMLQTWASVLSDASITCSLPHAECARDYERAKRGVETRGLGFLTLDLPAIDADLLFTLENGYLPYEAALCRRRSSRDARPRFLWALWSRVIDINGMLLEDADPNAILMLRQLSCFFKKYEVACSPKRVNDAVKDYYAIDQELRSPSLNWNGDSLEQGSHLAFVDALDQGSLPLFQRGIAEGEAGCLGFLARLDKVAAILASGLGPFDSMSEDSPETGFYKHGPGAVSNRPDNAYKYAFPTWSDKLEGVFPFDWCATGSLGDSPSSKTEPPSALLAVPKTAKAPRLIAAEPLEHQWCQQKIMTWLDHAFRHSLVGSFVDLRDQTLSQRLVTQASVDRSLATIDLSAASDRVSCWHIERLLRANRTLLDAVHASRTRRIVDRVTSRDSFLLRKFASMGSAVTFPLQCLFFLSVCLAACGADSIGSIRALRGKVRVFGDDIIVPNEAYDSVVHALTTLGLKVNNGKSFHRGFFRESCGQDSWRGYDVTPVKPKNHTARTPIGLDSLTQLSNNLYLKGFWYASDRVAGLLPARAKNVVQKVTVDSRSSPKGVLGLSSYSGSWFGHIKYDRYLQSWYAPVLGSLTRVRTRCLDDASQLIEHFTRPFSHDHARELGVRDARKAGFASLRVTVTP